MSLENRPVELMPIESLIEQLPLREPMGSLDQKMHTVFTII